MDTSTIPPPPVESGATSVPAPAQAPAQVPVPVPVNIQEPALVLVQLLTPVPVPGSIQEPVVVIRGNDPTGCSRFCVNFRVSKWYGLLVMQVNGKKKG